MDIKQVDVIKKEGVLYGFRYYKAVVYAAGNDVHEAFINAWKSLGYESKLDTPSITSDDEAVEVYTPQPSKAVSLEFYSEYHSVVLKEPVMVNFKSKAYDQYGQELDVEYDKSAVIDTIGKHEFTATCGSLTEMIEIEAFEYVEPEDVVELSIEDILLEQEERITALEIGGM